MPFCQYALLAFLLPVLLYPALFVLLAAAGHGKGAVGYVLGNYRACAGIHVIPHLYGDHKGGLAAQEYVIANGGAVLLKAIVIYKYSVGPKMPPLFVKIIV